MSIRRALGTGVAFLLATIVAPLSCLLRYEEEESANEPPQTFFDVSTPDTSYTSDIFLRWVGTDKDTDIAAYQYRLVATDSLYYQTQGMCGQVLYSLDPAGPADDTLWSTRRRENFTRFFELDDGYYEFSVRSIDATGRHDPNPARTRFYVFFDDIPPVAVIESACGRLNGVTTKVFTINASDRSRRSTTPRSRLEYQYRLRALNSSLCKQHLNDPFTEWKKFPPNDLVPVLIGNQAPTFYNDLYSRGCRWEFNVRVRDAAGNVGTASCEIMQF